MDDTTVDASDIDGSTFAIILQSVSASPPSPRGTRSPRPTPAPPPSPVLPFEAPKGICGFPLPALVNFAAANDPANYSALLDQLLGLGFEPGNCAEALRASLYHPDIAVEYLRAG
jgi:hypothetical protein